MPIYAPALPYQGSSLNFSSTLPTFIFVGESNASGEALNSALASDELDANPSMQILNNTTLLLESLDIGTNNMIGQNATPILATAHGWEAGLQQHLLGEAGELGCYLLKLGQSGSSISEWANGSAYSNTFNSRVSAFRALVPSTNYRVWLSFGINDANAGTNPTTWRTNTEAWIARIRTSVGVPTLKFFAVKLMANSTAKGNINTQLDAIAAADSNFHLLDASSTAAYPLQDTNHWNAASMKLIAQGLLQLEASLYG